MFQKGKKTELVKVAGRGGGGGGGCKLIGRWEMRDKPTVSGVWVESFYSCFHLFHADSRYQHD